MTMIPRISVTDHGRTNHDLGRCLQCHQVYVEQHHVGVHAKFWCTIKEVVKNLHDWMSLNQDLDAIHHNEYFEDSA